MPRRAAALLVLLAALIALSSAAAARASAPPQLRVAGNRLLGAGGVPLRLLGVNRPGGEYACAQGWALFGAPRGDAAIAAMRAWHIDAVRVPLNEDCWLGINGVKARYSGAPYREAVRSYVARLQRHRLSVILDLHWGAPGSTLALGQEQAPDADHAIAFWASVARRFRGVPGLAFDLFNEPHDVSWACWRDGCTTAAGWRAAGMQQLVNAVRGAGARQPVIAEGLDWGDDLSGWLHWRPRDPARRLVAGWHVYNFSRCASPSCWEATVSPVARRVPVLATEVGENDCAGGFLAALLPWADRRHVGYLAWAWNTGTCAGGPSLTSDERGTPTPYGRAYLAHLIALARDSARRPAGSG
jgi:endoglucanase